MVSNGKSIYKWMIYNGFPKSSIYRLAFSMINHPAMGVPPWPWKPRLHVVGLSRACQLDRCLHLCLAGASDGRYRERERNDKIIFRITDKSSNVHLSVFLTSCPKCHSYQVDPVTAIYWDHRVPGPSLRWDARHAGLFSAL